MPPPLQLPDHLHKKAPTSLPDFLLTAFSLFFLFSSSLKPTIKIPPFLSFPLNPRKFLKISTMPLKNPNPNNSLFPTPQSLSDWLRPRLPSDSFALWGVKPGTKNIHNLWLELSEGEISLANSTPPLRTVEVVVVRILGKDNKVLVESKQELSDGTIRNRGRPLSEKMKPGETVEMAVFRAVKEELGSIVKGSFGNFDNGNGSVRIQPNSYKKIVEERVSISYPGLPACYVLHNVDAVVEGLPEIEFSTEEGEEYGNCEDKEVVDGAVSCRKHYWKWVEADSV